MSDDQASRPKDASKIVSELERIHVTSQRQKAILRFSILAILIAAVLSYAFFRPNSQPDDAVTPQSNPVPGLDAAEPITDIVELRSLASSGNWSVMLRDYQKSLEIKPKDAVLHALMCSALINTFRYREAEVVAQKLVAIAPDFPGFRVMLSDCQFFCGKIVESVSSLEIAKQAYDSKDPNAVQADEKLEKRKRLLQLSTQQSSTNELLECDPADAVEFANLCRYQDKFELAVSYYNRILSRESDQVERSFRRFHLLLGFIHQALARKDLQPGQRNFLHSVGLEWLSQQLEFALQDPANDPDSGSVQNRGKLMEIQKDLLTDLRERESMRIIQAAIADPQIDPNQKKQYQHLMLQIQQTK